MQKNKELIVLGSLLAAALLLAGGVWAFYALQQKVEDQTPTNGESENQTEAEDYRKNIKVTFTSDVYPPDSYQTNPRLRQYIGKTQNTGTKTLLRADIKVVYLDKAGKAIYEYTVPISATLKPNFIHEFQFGGLQVPSDWSGEVDYEIISYTLENDRVIKVPAAPYRPAPLERPLQRILFPL